MSDHDNSAIVAAFCDAWTRHDVDAIVDSFTDDAVYHNIPMDPLEGKAAIEAGIRGFLGTMTITFDTHLQVADGDVVMNERTDTVTAGDKVTVMPVMGVFVLRDGKIAEWRDYFDLATFTGGGS
ncbi:MAG: SgcJ/EcaC family oxidoreductase [Actinomycetota bacterium]